MLPRDALGVYEISPPLLVDFIVQELARCDAKFTKFFVRFRERRAIFLAERWNTLSILQELTNPFSIFLVNVR